MCMSDPYSICLYTEEIDVTGCSSQDASIDSDDVYADDDDDADSDPVLSANKAFTMSLRLSRPL